MPEYVITPVPLFTRPNKLRRRALVESKMLRIRCYTKLVLLFGAIFPFPEHASAFQTASPVTRFHPPTPLSSRPLTTIRRHHGRHKTLKMSEESSDALEKEGTGQGVLSSSFNLMKAILGSGVLTLPYGVAVMSNTKQSVIPASIFLLALGGLSAYTFYLAGRLCHFSDADTIGDLWDQEIGKKTSWMISSAIVTFTLGAALSYSIVLGDTFSSLALGAGMTGFVASRQASILGITISALYPLCRLSSLKALAPASIIGVVGVIITCVFMAARCFLPTSPYKLPDGHFLATLPHQYLPSFGTQSNLASPSALILVAMACCAFQTHYAAPDFYKALRKNDKVLTNFRNLTILGFAGVSLINIAILAFGFLTFGANSQGIILNNYSTKDLGASVCRLLMATSVIGGFPFLISAAKSAFFKLNYDIRCLTNESCERIEPTKATNRLVTQGFVAIVTGLALMLEDAGFVVSFNGALVGSAIVYIFPSVLFLQATKRRLKEGSIQLTRKLRLERYLSRFLVGFGVATGVLGAAVTVLNYFYPGALRQ